MTYTNDMNGQVIRRDESDNNWSQGDPHEIWFRYGGREMGYSGNNGTTDTDYQTSVAQRTRAAPTTTTGAFRGGATGGAMYVDSDPSIRKINSFEQGGSGGGYTVRAGDTLSGIAANLWGDASLWYKLAEINGLTANSALAEGTKPSHPGRGVQEHPQRIDVQAVRPGRSDRRDQPHQPQAARKNKCGVFGAILLVVVAVAVTIATQGAATGFFTTAFTGSAVANSAAAAAAATAGGIAGAKLPVRKQMAATGASAHAPSARTPGAADLPPTPPVPRSVCCWHC